MKLVPKKARSFLKLIYKASNFPLSSKILNKRNISKTVRVLPFRFPLYIVTIINFFSFLLIN